MDELTMIRNQILNSEELMQFKELLLRHRLTIGVAESLSCGNIQAVIGSISGASSFFYGGVTAYNIDQKVNLLGVDRIHAESVNCVSPQVAQEMAIGVCKKFNSHIGVGTTGYAETPINAEHNHPYAYFAIVANGELVKENKIKMLEATRVEAQQRVTKEVLLALISYLKTFKTI